MLRGRHPIPGGRLLHRVPAAERPDGVGRLAAAEGHRHLGQQPAGRLGVRHHQLRLVDRYRPRRHADFGDSPAAQAGLAHLDQPLRRGDDAVRGRLRADVPADPHRPAVARGLLAAPLSEHDGDLAAVPQPADLGRVRGLDLRHGVGAVLVRGPGPRPRDAARSREEQARQRGCSARSRSAGADRRGTGRATRRPTCCSPACRRRWCSRSTPS